ncbi:hypothetical protein [Roseimaritima ulvae]|uniref:Histidine kinase n=1 Tax=Roseimaritima ulvae TaxID=980254 RepID=A0A5B9QZZ2_9BACT|nr:hypothetical protein [Roseimaritima ulvae]QEG42726.1 hypothetical protein UC8_47680 [Roseimaritima ulvae]
MPLPQPCPSLRQLVETVSTEALASHHASISLELDIDPQIPVPADPADVAQLLQQLLRQSLNEMDEGELSLIAWQGPNCLELEIGDTGGPIEDRCGSLPLVGGKLGSQIIRQNCPQGGAAITIRFPQRAAQREAA